MHFRNSCTRSISSCCMRQVPSGASGGLGLNGLICFFTRKFHETSVTKSFNIGKAFIGSTVTGLSNGNSLSRVIHMSFGIPLTSAEHDPHFPALQFHRQARSGACVRWISCTASSTTIPSAVFVDAHIEIIEQLFERSARLQHELDLLEEMKTPVAFGDVVC